MFKNVGCRLRDPPKSVNFIIDKCLARCLDISDATSNEAERMQDTKDKTCSILEESAISALPTCPYWGRYIYDVHKIFRFF